MPEGENRMLFDEGQIRTAFVASVVGMVGLLVVLLWAHVLVYAALLFAAGWLLRRFALERIPGARLRALVVCVAVVGLLGWSIVGRPYDTQFHHSRAHASLLEIYR